MNKAEFLGKLKEYLGSYNIDRSVINENLDYYSIYIDSQVNKGRSEEDVIKELGEPTIIGRSIIDQVAREQEKTGKGSRVKYTYSAQDDSSYERASDPGRKEGSGGKGLSAKAKMILSVAAVCIILFLVVGLIASLFRLFLPVAIVGLITIGIVLLTDKRS